MHRNSRRRQAEYIYFYAVAISISVRVYDGNGSLIGFKDLSTDKDYFYLKNLQGDIVKIIDSNKTVVATYEYDDWGKLLVSEDSLTAVGKLNPFRYRGYYYDTESSLYYLNSRYYDPETGRFINADTYVSTGQGLSGNNMFAYCNGNPIINIDIDGEWAATVISGLVGGFFNAMSAITSGGDIVDVGLSFSIGFVNGVIGSVASGTALIRGAISGVIGAVNSISVQWL